MTKRLKAVELFLAVGLVAGLAACGGAETPTALETEPDVAAQSEGVEGVEGAESVEGGEGGEGGDYSAGEQANAANADFEDKLSGSELLSALQEGGHVI